MRILILLVVLAAIGSGCTTAQKAELATIKSSSIAFVQKAETDLVSASTVFVQACDTVLANPTEFNNLKIMVLALMAKANLSTADQTAFNDAVSEQNVGKLQTLGLKVLNTAQAVQSVTPK
jgi:hypothetical protein